MTGRKPKFLRVGWKKSFDAFAEKPLQLEKPSKSNPCAKNPYIDSWLMAHTSLKSDLKGRQAKASRRKGLLKYEEMEAQTVLPSIAFMSRYKHLDCG